MAVNGYETLRWIFGGAAGLLVLWATGHALKILLAEAREARRVRIEEARRHAERDELAGRPDRRRRPSALRLAGAAVAAAPFVVTPCVAAWVFLGWPGEVLVAGTSAAVAVVAVRRGRIPPPRPQRRG